VIFGRDNRKRWSKWDIVLLEAFEILEQERCGKCGTPKYLAYNDSDDILFRVHEETCHACAAIERHDRDGLESRKNKDGGYDDPEPGIMAVPIAWSYTTDELGSYRGPYYEAEAERWESIKAGWASERRAE